MLKSLTKVAQVSKLPQKSIPVVRKYATISMLRRFFSQKNEADFKDLKSYNIHVRTEYEPKTSLSKKKFNIEQQQHRSRVTTTNKIENDSLGLYELETVLQLVEFLENMDFEFELHEQINILDRLIELLAEEGFSINELDKLGEGSNAGKVNFRAEEVVRIKSGFKKLIGKVKFNLGWMIKDDLFCSINFEELMEKCDYDQELYQQKVQEWVDSQNQNDDDLEYDQKFPKIGTLLSQMKFLQVKDLALWERLSEFLIEERYSSGLHESVYAMEGLTFYHELLEEQEEIKENFLNKNKGRSGGVVRALQGGKKDESKMLESNEKAQQKLMDENDEEFLRKMYQLDSRKSKAASSINKLGLNIIKRMRDENQLTLNSLALSLHQLSSVLTSSPEITCTDALYDKLDTQIIKSLGLNYSSQLILDTMYLMAVEGRGSSRLYEAGQRVLYLGKYMGFEGWRLYSQGLGREQNSTGLGMALGMTDSLHSSKANLLKIVDVYTHAQTVKNIDKEGDKIQVDVNLQQLFIKEMRKVLDSGIKSLSLSEISKIYRFLPIFELDEFEDVKEMTEGLKQEVFNFLLGDKPGSVSLQELNEFLNQFGIWEMENDIEEYKMLLQGIEKGKFLLPNFRNSNSLTRFIEPKNQDQR